MQKASDYAGGVALFLAGLAAGVISAKSRLRQTAGSATHGQSGDIDLTAARESLRRIGELETRIAAQEKTAERLGRMGSRIDEYTARLSHLPTTSELERRLDEYAARLAQQQLSSGELPLSAQVEARLDEFAALLEQRPAAAQIENRLAAHEGATAERLAKIEARLKEHGARLADVPTNAQLESRLAAQENALAESLGEIKVRLDDHAAKLANVPTTPQIIAAMEQLLAKTMSSLDDRLATQAHSIQVLTTTVSQTDNLLERVLESLDTLQTEPESPELLPIGGRGEAQR